MSELEQVFHSLLGLFLVSLAISFISYLIKAFVVYSLARKSNQKYLWMSFVPILQEAKVFRLAGLTEKFFFVAWVVSVMSGVIPIPYFAAIVGLVYSALRIYVKWRTAKNFGGDTLLCVLNLFFEPFVLIYIAISNRKFANTPMNQYVTDFIHKLQLDDKESADSQIIDAEVIVESDSNNIEQN